MKIVTYYIEFSYNCLLPFWLAFLLSQHHGGNLWALKQRVLNVQKTFIFLTLIYWVMLLWVWFERRTIFNKIILHLFEFRWSKSHLHVKQSRLINSRLQIQTSISCFAIRKKSITLWDPWISRHTWNKRLSLLWKYFKF